MLNVLSGRNVFLKKLNLFKMRIIWVFPVIINLHGIIVQENMWQFVTRMIIGQMRINCKKWWITWNVIQRLRYVFIEY